MNRREFLKSIIPSIGLAALFPKWATNLFASLSRLFKFKRRGEPVPLFEVVSNPEIPLSEIKARRFNIIESNSISDLN